MSTRDNMDKEIQDRDWHYSLGGLPMVWDDTCIKVSLDKNAAQWKADAQFLPGTPPVGIGQSPDEAIGNLLRRLRDSEYQFRVFTGEWTIEIEGL